MKKHTSLFIKLLTLDLVTKLVAYLVAPKNSVFFLTFNRDMVFNIVGGDLVKFVVPLLILPLFFLMGLYLNKNQKSIYFQIVMAGVLGNYVCRFMDVGVVDFIVLGSVNANLADIYCWSSYMFFTLCVIDNFGLNKKEVSFLK